MKTLTTFLLTLVFAAPAIAANRTVCAAGCEFRTIQAAVSAAVAGDVITIRADETFTETITLPNKGVLAQPITIRSDAADVKLPAAGYRAKPDLHAAYMPDIQAPPGGEPALKTAAGARDYVLMGLEFRPNPGGFNVIVEVGNNSARQQFVADEPKNIVLDRLIIRGDPVFGQKIGVDLNGATLTLKNSHIDRIAAVGQDAIGVRCLQGSGPLTVVNNYIAAAAENFICGGDDPQMHTNAQVVEGATTTRATLTNFRTGHTIATLKVGQLLAVLTAGATKRRYTHVRGINPDTNTITFDAIPEVPDTGANSDIRWGVIFNTVVVRRNHFYKPVAWMDPVLATPANVHAAPSTSAGSLAAGTYCYRVVARNPAGYNNMAIHSAAAAEQCATLRAPGHVQISWRAVSNATQYRVFGRASGAPAGYFETTGTSLTDMGAALTTASIASPSKWVVKTLFETKFGYNYQVDSNVLDYSWTGADLGYSVWLKSNNQDGTCEFCQTKDLVFEKNVIRHAAGGFNLLGYNTNHGASGYPPPMENITIRHNLLYDSNSNWIQGGATTWVLKTSNTIRNLRIEHNTFIHHMRGFVYLTDAPVEGLVIKDNLGRAEEYGVFGMSCTPGADCLNKNTVGSVWTFAGNVIAGASASRYPKHNLYPDVTEFETQHFEAYGGGVSGNYALKATSRWKGTATDGTDRGADIAALTAAVNGVVDGTPE